MSWRDDVVVDQPKQPAWASDMVIEVKPNARAIAPPVDQSTADMDPRDLRERNLLTSRSPEAVTRRAFLSATTGPMDRAAMRVGDAGFGLLQLAAKPFGGSETLDNMLREREERRRQGMLIRGENPYEFSPVELAGNVLGGVVAGPTKAAPAATMLGRAAQGAKFGAAGGAAQVVDPDAQDYWAQKGAQVGAGAMTGGIATPAMEGLVRAVAPAVNAVAKRLRAGRVTQQQVDEAIAQATAAQGINWGSLAADVKQSLRDDVARALNTGGTVDDQALRRLADIRAVGATPTRGTVTMEPGQVTRERNLAKIGANSTDPTLQRLYQVEQANNRALIDRLGGIAPTTADEFQAGARVIGALKAGDAQSKKTVQRLYGEAEALNQGAITMDGAQFVNVASQALDEARRGAFLPGQVRTIMNEIVERQRQGVPMTLNDAEQLRTILAAENRKAARAGDGNVQMALAVVRDALEGTPTNSLRGEVADAAFRRARGAHRARMQTIEDSPALAAALDDADPDRFVRQFITGGGASVRDVNALRRAITNDPEAFDAVRGQIVNHLKSKALGATDDPAAATFRQASYNQALNAIGDRKLAAFFSPEEIARLRQIGRVATYLQAQPKGSAVNNSNTASAAVGLLDRIVSMKLPAALGDAARMPINSLRAQSGARNALRDVLPATGGDVIDDAALNRILRLAAPTGGALGVVAAQ